MPAGTQIYKAGGVLIIDTTTTPNLVLGSQELRFQGNGITVTNRITDPSIALGTPYGYFIIRSSNVTLAQALTTITFGSNYVDIACTIPAGIVGDINMVFIYGLR